MAKKHGKERGKSTKKYWEERNFSTNIHKENEQKFAKSFFYTSPINPLTLKKLNIPNNPLTLKK